MSLIKMNSEHFANPTVIMFSLCNSARFYLSYSDPSNKLLQLTITTCWHHRISSVACNTAASGSGGVCSIMPASTITQVPIRLNDNNDPTPQFHLCTFYTE